MPRPVSFGKATSICHIPRRKNNREGTEADIAALLADEGGGGGADSDGYKKSVIFLQ